jgi:hypothetical protein
MQQEPSDSLPAETVTNMTDTTSSPDQAPASQAAAASTGEPRVDAALDRLDELADLGVHDHPAVFERVHAELIEVLGELEPDAGEHQPGLAAS